MHGNFVLHAVDKPTAARRRFGRRVWAGAAGVALAAGSIGGTLWPTVASGDTATVVVTDNATYGPILTTGSGLALYTSSGDHNGVSACTGSCLAVWPPLTVPAGTTPTTGAGVPAGSIGTSVQSDGRTQVTYSGAPLYTFVSDTPGSAGGQGVGGFSLVEVTPAPTTTMAPATPTTTSPPSSPTTTSASTSPTTTATSRATTTTKPPSGTAYGGATTVAGGSSTGATTPATASGRSVGAATAPSSLAVTGAGAGLRSFAVIGIGLSVLGGFTLLLLSTARRQTRKVNR